VRLNRAAVDHRRFWDAMDRLGEGQLREIETRLSRHMVTEFGLDPTGWRWTLSRPVEDCEGCPTLAGVRNLGLDDPSAGRPDSHCNFGDRRIRAGRATAARSARP
jgi:hypothetical protein